MDCFYKVTGITSSNVELDYYFANWHQHLDVGNVVKINNGTTIFIKNVELVSLSLNQINERVEAFPMVTLVDTFKVVSMTFPSSNKEYHYYTRAKDWLLGQKWKKKDGTIMTFKGYVAPWESRATKILPDGHRVPLDDEWAESYTKDWLVYGSGFKLALLPTDNRLYIGQIIKIKDRYIKIESFENAPHNGATFLKYIQEPISVKELPIDTVFKILLKSDYRTARKKWYDFKNMFENENEKEIKPMNNIKNKFSSMLFGDLSFGKIKTPLIKFSLNGIAFRDRGDKYSTYDVKKNELTDVTPFVFDMDFVFEMPMAVKDIKEGDIINHKGVYVVIKTAYEDGSFAAVDPIAAQEITILPVKNVFGFNYVSKVVNLFEGMKPDAENPFGNINSMLPFMMMSDNGDNSNMLMAMALAGNGLGAENGLDFMKNPLMLMALCK